MNHTRPLYILLLLLLGVIPPEVQAQEEKLLVPLVEAPITNEPVLEPEFTTNATVVREGSWGGRATSGNDVVRVGSDVTVGADEELETLVVIDGNAKILGKVRELVVVLGDVEIMGEVTGDLVVVAGNATLREGAVVGGTATAVGGRLKVHDQAQVHGDQEEIVAPIPNLRGIGDYSLKGLMRARPFPPGVRLAWVVAGVCLLFYLLLNLLFPKPIQNCLGVLQNRSVASFFVGLLSLIMFPLVVIFLAITVVGILAIPFLVCGFLVALLFGKIAIFRLTGQRFGHQIGAAILEKPIFALMVGAIIFSLLYMIPIIGLAVWGLAATMALGAGVLAVFDGGKETALVAAPAGVAPPGIVVRPAPIQPVITTPSLPSTIGIANPAPPLTPATPVSAATPPPFPGSAASMQRVGFWLRFWATFIDYILLAIIIIPTGLPPLFLIVAMAYFIGLWTWKGSSIGGLILRIRVVQTNGRPVDFPVALIRSLASIFSGLVFGIGFFWAGWTRDKQSWHDKISDTIVVRTRPNGVNYRTADV